MKPPEVEVKHEATWNLSPVSMVVLNCFSTVLEAVWPEPDIILPTLPT